MDNAGVSKPLLTNADRMAVWQAISRRMLADDRDPNEVIRVDYGGDEDAYLRLMAGWHNVPIGEDSPVNLYDWGVDMAQSGQLEKALDFFSKAVNIKPEFIDARYNKAVTLYALKRYDEAQAEYVIVLSERPEDVDALNNLGAIHAHKGDLNQAGELFKKALAVEPKNALTHRNLATYYKLIGDLAKCAEHVRQATQLNSVIFETEPSPPHINPPTTG
jgi:tetratricopeptide (TPR) repeat protein